MYHSHSVPTGLNLTGLPDLSGFLLKIFFKIGKIISFIVLLRPEKREGCGERTPKGF